MPASPADFEKLGLFYLGGEVDPAGRGEPARPLLYESRHLVTHGVIVGMTGSGKTGLGAVLLEEAAIDGVPAVVIDPKGDLGNLLLTFPEARPEDYAPWVAENERPEEVAARAREGLAGWGQDGDRVRRYERAVDRALYTPGAGAGERLSVLRGLGAPEPGADPDAVRERAVAVTSSLLGLVGVEADPLRSPAHTLVASVLTHGWATGSALDLAGLLRAIQAPPFARLGVMDVDAVVPPRERQGLALAINNAFASPAFAGFLEGEPLDAERLLRTRDGRPRLSVISIAHLGDAERMFFVTLLLGELIAWMRRQPGTSSLRALLYMDEVFGFFPPVAAPPAKAPMLTLLKQARAFGLGVVLATQNPVDLDYKSLSNAGTWWIGRLQTERDRMRVLDGLEGSAQATGSAFDRAGTDARIASLGKRVFLQHSVHAPAPAVFESRWALSYLRGPMTREQIQRVSAEARARRAASGADVVRHAGEGRVSLQPGAHGDPGGIVGRAGVAAGGGLVPGGPEPGGPVPGGPAASASVAGAVLGGAGSLAAAGPGARPVLPPEVREVFVRRDDLAAPVRYEPGLLVRAEVHYVLARHAIDHWLTPVLLVPFAGDRPDFARAWVVGTEPPPLSPAPEPRLPFAALPAPAGRAASYAAWAKEAAAHLYKDRPLVVYTAPSLDLVGRPFEPRDHFVARATDALRLARDEAVADLQRTWGPRLDRAREKLRRAQEKVGRLEDARGEAAFGGAIDLGAGVLGAVLGRRSSLTRSAAGAAKRARKAAARAEQLAPARAEHEAARAALARLEAEAQAAFRALAEAHDPARLEVRELPIAAKKGDLRVDPVALAWVPVG
jgi:hypothetical protein